MLPETKYARSGDVHIAYQVMGNGPIELVVAPGWVTHVEYNWEEPLAYGGEEFMLILPEASLEVTRGRAEDLRLEARQIRIQSKGQVLDAITLSLGVAVFPDHGSAAADSLAAADSTLYRAKRDGRDRVVAAT